MKKITHKKIIRCNKIKELKNLDKCLYPCTYKQQVGTGSDKTIESLHELRNVEL